MRKKNQLHSYFLLFVFLLLPASILSAQEIPEPERLTGKSAGPSTKTSSKPSKSKEKTDPVPSSEQNSGQEVPDELVLQCVDMFVVNQDKQLMETVSAAKCVSPGATCYLVVTKMGQSFSCVSPH